MEKSTYETIENKDSYRGVHIVDLIGRRNVVALPNWAGVFNIIGVLTLLVLEGGINSAVIT